MSSQPRNKGTLPDEVTALRARLDGIDWEVGWLIRACGLLIFAVLFLLLPKAFK